MKVFEGQEHDLKNSFCLRGFKINGQRVDKGRKEKS